jgi:hypothetical protein
MRFQPLRFISSIFHRKGISLLCKAGIIKVKESLFSYPLEYFLQFDSTINFFSVDGGTSESLLLVVLLFKNSTNEDEILKIIDLFKQVKILKILKSGYPLFILNYYF